MIDPNNPRELGTYLKPRYLWWDSLGKITTSKAIRRFTVFLIVVPFVTAVIEAIPSFAPIRLPLTWLFGYAAGLCFFLGMVLVAIWCPDINKPGRTFQTIGAEGRTIQYIIQEMREIYIHLAKSEPKRANHFLRGILASNQYVENPNELEKHIPDSSDHRVLDRTLVWQLVDDAKFKKSSDSMQELFWNLHWYAGNLYPKKRHICFSLFTAGTVFAFFLLLIQCIRVLSSFLRYPT